MANLIRVLVFLTTFALAVIAIGAGANSFAKSNDQKIFVKSHLPLPGLKVDINTQDIFSVGVVLLVGCAGLALTSFVAFLTSFINLSFIPRLLESLTFAFWATWILACDIANTIISRTRSAKVTAVLGQTTLDPAVVQQDANALGVSPRYWSNGFIRFYAIVTWFTFMFAVLAAVVSLLSRPKRSESKA